MFYHSGLLPPPRLCFCQHFVCLFVCLSIGPFVCLSCSLFVGVFVCVNNFMYKMSQADFDNIFREGQNILLGQGLINKIAVVIQIIA